MDAKANPGSSQDPRQLAGPQRAAAILLAMGKPPATRLLKHLEPHELREVTRAAARLGAVPPGELETLVEEFTAAFSAGASLMGDVGKARDMLTDVAPPEEVADILSEVSMPGDLGVWNALGGVPEAVLQGYLANEHPLVATYILSKLAPQLAAQVVARMPREARNEVLVAMIVRPVRLRGHSAHRRRRSAQGPRQSAGALGWARQPCPHRRHHQQP